MRIIVSHPGEQREQVRSLHRHQAGVGQFDGLFEVRRILLLDHLHDLAALNDHTTIAGGVFRLERQYHYGGRVHAVQPINHCLHRCRRHERNITIKDQYIAIESRQRTLGLLHRMACAKLRFLHHGFGTATQRVPQLVRLVADNDDFLGGRKRINACHQMHQHRPASYRVQHLVQI